MAVVVVGVVVVVVVSVVVVSAVVDRVVVGLVTGAGVPGMSAIIKAWIGASAKFKLIESAAVSILVNGGDLSRVPVFVEIFEAVALLLAKFFESFVLVIVLGMLMAPVLVLVFVLIFLTDPANKINAR